MSGGGEVSLVRGYAKTVHLRLGVLDGARTDSRKRLPEPDGVVVTSVISKVDRGTRQAIPVQRITDMMATETGIQRL